MEGIVNITSENSEILATGSFITFQDEESAIHLNHKKERITLYLKFIDEDGKTWSKDREQTFEVIDDESGRIVFHNYSNGLGIFSLKPMHLGDIGNQELFFQYKIDDLFNTPSKLVFYSFYLGKEINNG